MRAALVGLLAGLLLPVALASAWSAAVVTDTERYVATVGPLAGDPDVADAVERSLTLRAMRVVDDAGLTAETALDLGLDELVAGVVTRVVESPDFRSAWEAANAEAHVDLLAGLEGEGAAEPVRIDLGGVLDAVVADLGASLPVEVPAPGVALPVTVLEADQVEQGRDPYAVLAATGVWLPVLWVLGVVLALVVVRRRARLLGWLGAASGVGLVLLLLGLGLARDRVVAAVPDVDRELSGAVWDSVTTDLRVATLLGLAVAAVLLVLGLLGGLVRRR